MPRPTYGLDDFLRELADRTRAEGIEWHLTGGGRIRTTDSLGRSLCPMAYVAEESNLYEWALKKRGMRVRDIDAVMAAADFPSPGKKFLPLRRQLLEITGAE